MMIIMGMNPASRLLAPRNSLINDFKIMISSFIAEKSILSKYNERESTGNHYQHKDMQTINS